MPIKTKTYSFLILLLVTLAGCGTNASGTYKYDAMENVTFTVNTKKLKHHGDIKSVFLYFELTIQNNSNKDIYLNVGEIQAKLNGELSSETHYDSLASVLPKKERLKKGQTELKLYFVFSENQINKKLKEFNVVNYGLG